MITRRFLIPAVAITLFVQACVPEEDTSVVTQVLDLPQSPYHYFDNGFNNQIPTLGRVLFYDAQLSVNNSVSCGSCHKQTLAFSDNARFSRGFDNRVTSRNSMPIQNLVQFIGFVDSASLGGPRMDLKHVPSILFWDGRETNLRQMVMRPIVNHIEMGITDLQQLSEKLSVIPYYKHLFKKAYGTEAVTPDKISEALTAFIASITSNNTKFDKALRGQLQLSALEAHGRNLFFEKYDCNACHQVQSSSGYIQAGTFSNIGLDKVYQDQGVAEVTKNDSDIGKFKIPSLRNVMFTAPYMHDGRFETLEEVLDHYSHGVEDHPNLDVRLKDQSGKPLVLNISQDEKRAIIAFLATLTDTDMLNHPKFANPFKTH